MIAHKHTPAPWRVMSGKYGLQIHSESHWIANLKCESCPAHEEANARLIAAAPDLLEAAKTVLDGLHQRIDAASRDGGAMPVYAGIAALHAAIAKATGAA